MHTRMHPLSKAIYDVRNAGLVELASVDRRELFTTHGGP